MTKMTYMTQLPPYYIYFTKPKAYFFLRGGKSVICIIIVIVMSINQRLIKTTVSFPLIDAFHAPEPPPRSPALHNLDQAQPTENPHLPVTEPPP